MFRRGNPFVVNCRHRRRRARTSRRSVLLPLAFTLLIVASAVSTAPHGVLADDDVVAAMTASPSTDPTEEPTADVPADESVAEPVDPTPTDPMPDTEIASPPPPESVETVEQPTETPADAAAPEATATPPDDQSDADAAAQTASPDPTEPPPTETATPAPLPTLSFSPASHPVCKPVDDRPDVVAAGESLDYRCSFALDLAAAHLAPSTVLIDWSVNASVTAGWSTQLLPPGADSQWTAEGSDIAGFAHQSLLADPDLTDSTDPFTTRQRIAFGLRLHRPDCGAETPSIELAVSAVPSIPTVENAVVTQERDQPDPYELTPVLAPIAETAPTVTIQDVAITPSTFSLTDQVTHGTLTIVVDNPTQQCHAWNVVVGLRAFTDREIPDAAVLRAVGDPSGASGAGIVAVGPQTDRQSLATPVVVAVVQAGADPGRSTQTLGFDLTIPGQTSVGAYRARATADVAPS